MSNIDDYDDPFPKDALQRVCILSANRGCEITPDQLKAALQSFFVSVLEGLARQGYWLTTSELIDWCSHPLVRQLTTNLAEYRGIQVAEATAYIDTISSLLRSQ